MQLMRLATLVAVVMACGPRAANAGFIAYSVPTSSHGNQAFGGSLGMEFTVNNSISITALGVYDDNQDGLHTDLHAAIFSLDVLHNTGSLIQSVDFLANHTYTAIGASVFQAVDMVLTPGDYAIVAWGYGASEHNGNYNGDTVGLSTLNDGGGLITFHGDPRWGVPGGSFPNQVELYRYTNSYWAGTFEFQSASLLPDGGNVPEPASMLLLGSGLVAFSLARRYRKATPRG